MTDTSGAIISAVELDPFGADTPHSGSSAFQPRKFTSYERDANGSDDAMFRRYNRWHTRFDQPDPYEGSYDLSDPQSFNRYAYTQGDPVNFTDPSGLQKNEDCWKDERGELICVEVVSIYTWADRVKREQDRLFDFRFVLDSWFAGFTGGRTSRPQGSVKPPYRPENFQYTSCIGAGIQVCTGCIFDDQGVKPTVGVSVGPSTIISLQGSKGEGNMASNVYINGGFVLPAPGGLTFSTPIDHPISGFSGSDKNLGTPQIGVGVQYVFPPLKGTTPYDWAHHRDNPQARHKFLSPVGRCVD